MGERRKTLYYILPSEKAKAYEMKLEAIRRKAGRPSKENSRQVGANFSGVKTTQIIGEQSGDSTRQVERFIRLNKLTPELMQMVDDGKLKTTPAVELSYLTPEEQEDFLSYMESEGCTPSLSQAQKLKEASKESVLTPEKIQHIMAAKPPSVKPRDPQLMADEYLSGNVREKLRIAHVAADQDPAFRINVEALEQVQPKDLTAGEITVRLGVTWIGPEIIKQFADELFQSTYREQKIAVRYNEYLNNWYISNKSQGNDNIRVTNTYGTKRINGYHLLENALNLRATKIYDTVYDENGKEQHKLNGPATEEAQAKQRMIEDAFKDWIFKDRERRESLVALYNEKFNCIRPREYDGSHIQFFGMNPEIALRPHQRNAIAHILYGHNTLLAHVVGAGKTYEMVAAAMEKKRLGLCSKTLVAVPNHLTGQFASEALKLYPNANILVTTQRDFEKSNRKRFCAKIATGNYDIVVIGHSQFEKIPLSDARKAEFIRKQIDELEMQLESMDNSDSRLTVKQLESKKKQLKTKLSNLLDAPKRDDVVTFEELGADSLMVDEAHNFKNLMTVTKMHNIAGISTTESQKASDLFMKCQYLDEITGARGVTFATGTPISNSMTELYTMQRYLQQYTLERNGLANFDSWAATFGETVTAIELAPEGYTLIGR